MTSVRHYARVLLAAPVTPGDAERVAALMVAYSPDQAYALGAPGAEAAAAAARVPLVGLEAVGPITDVIERLAAGQLGRCIAVLTGPAEVATTLAHALGVPLDSARSFEVAPDAISVLEVDSDARWAVMRVNEGALPWPG